MNENHSHLTSDQLRKNFYQMLGLLCGCNNKQLASVSTAALAQCDLALRNVIERIEIELDRRRSAPDPTLKNRKWKTVLVDGNLTDSEKAACSREEELTAAQQRGIIERALIDKDQMKTLIV